MAEAPWHDVGLAGRRAGGRAPAGSRSGGRAVCLGRLEGALGRVRRHLHARGVLRSPTASSTGTVVVCPCHGSEFDVRTGDVLSPPALDPLPIYEAREEDGALLVRLSAPPPRRTRRCTRATTTSRRRRRAAATVAGPSLDGLSLDDVDLTDLDRLGAAGAVRLARAAPARRAAASGRPRRDGRGFWSFTRYDDVVAVSKDWETFSSELGGTSLQDLTPDGARGAQVDARHRPARPHAPAGDRQQGLHAAGRQRLRGADPRARARDPRAAFEREAFDWVEDVAAEIPMWVFSEIMGLPVDDRKLIIELGDKMLGNTDPERRRRGVRRRDGARSDPELRMLPFSSPFSLDLIEYGRALGEARRRRAARRHHDEARRGRARRLAAQRAGVRHLLHPAHDRGQRDDPPHDQPRPASTSSSTPTSAAASSPTRRSRGTAADEMLRRAHPVHHFRRTATRDVELHGRRIEAGDKVAIWYASARTTTRRSSPTRTASTSAARRTATSPSASAGRTSASARTSRSWRSGSGSRR